MNKSEEQVFVVPREKLFEGRDLSNGFGTDDLSGLLKRILASGRFETRSRVEQDPTLKQIIPYLLVAVKDRVFVLRRYKTQTEKRLHHKHSLGVGGHINPELRTPNSELRTPKDIIEQGLERELHEELKISGPYTHKLVGYLNDDSNPVGQVHFGLVFRLEVADESAVEVAEKDLMEGKFMDRAGIKPLYHLLETWSQMLYDNLIKS